MKEYKIRVMYPGGCFEDYEIVADHFDIYADGHAYFFYDKDNNLIKAFPTDLTIIDKITKYKTIYV